MEVELNRFYSQVITMLELNLNGVLAIKETMVPFSGPTHQLYLLIKQIMQHSDHQSLTLLDSRQLKAVLQQPPLQASTQSMDMSLILLAQFQFGEDSHTMDNSIGMLPEVIWTDASILTSLLMVIHLMVQPNIVHQF